LTKQNVSVEGKPEAAIQQLNLRYSAEQDRLLLRVGLADNTELLVWLTYRITRRVWQLLNGQVHIPSATSIQTDTVPGQAVEQFKQEMRLAEKLQMMDFSTEYQPRKEIVHDGAMLAMDVLLITYEKKLPALEFPCLEGISVRMKLTQELILALCSMLQLTTKEAAWDMGVLVQAQVQLPLEADVGAKKVLH
jgi:hypothetical protein